VLHNTSDAIAADTYLRPQRHTCWAAPLGTYSVQDSEPNRINIFCAYRITRDGFCDTGLSELFGGIPVVVRFPGYLCATA